MKVWNVRSKFAMGLLVAAIAGSASAASLKTAISPVGSDPGVGLKEALVNAYKTSFAGYVGVSGSLSTTLTLTFASNQIDFVRVVDVDDTSAVGSGGPLLLKTGPGAADDDYWKDGTVKARVEAKVAGLGHNLLINDGSSDTTIFAGATPGQTTTKLLGPNFSWALETTAGKRFSSDPLLNKDGIDHMVTFEVIGLSSLKTWAIAWEDLPAYSSDTDYNDLVVQVSIVPLPAAVWAGLSLLSGLGVARRMRRA